MSIYLSLIASKNTRSISDVCSSSSQMAVKTLFIIGKKRESKVELTKKKSLLLLAETDHSQTHKLPTHTHATKPEIFQLTNGPFNIIRFS